MNRKDEEGQDGKGMKTMKKNQGTKRKEKERHEGYGPCETPEFSETPNQCCVVFNHI